jgi:hypothetical protein
MLLRDDELEDNGFVRFPLQLQGSSLNSQTPPIMARGHDEPRAAAPRIERATPHMTQPNAARGGGGPPMNARAQMPPPAAPRAAAPAMPQGGGGGHGQGKRQ